MSYSSYPSFLLAAPLGIGIIGIAIDGKKRSGTPMDVPVRDQGPTSLHRVQLEGGPEIFKYEGMVFTTEAEAKAACLVVAPYSMKAFSVGDKVALADYDRVFMSVYREWKRLQALELAARPPAPQPDPMCESAAFSSLRCPLVSGGLSHATSRRALLLAS